MAAGDLVTEAGLQAALATVADDVTDVVAALPWVGTQTEYDALPSTVEGRVYVIVPGP